MIKHTPAPWKAESYREPYNAHELTYHVVSDGFIVAKCGTGFETKENARLIAAAPELLEALHQISLCSKNSMSSKEECGHIARDAITKVRGDEA